jgi:hypothetical protein
VAGGWRRLRNDVITCKLQQNMRVIKSRRMRWARHAELMGNMRNACNIFVGKPERKRLFERSSRR